MLVARTVGVEDVYNVPTEFSLEQNFPNPFNPNTTISFRLAAPDRVRLGVYDVSGRLVSTLVDESELSAGDHQVVWNGLDQTGRASAAGIYFYHLEVGGFSQTRRMTMVK